MYKLTKKISLTLHTDTRGKMLFWWNWCALSSLCHKYGWQGGYGRRILLLIVQMPDKACGQSVCEMQCPQVYKCVITHDSNPSALKCFGTNCHYTTRVYNCETLDFDIAGPGSTCVCGGVYVETMCGHCQVVLQCHFIQVLSCHQMPNIYYHFGQKGWGSYDHQTIVHSVILFWSA